MSVLGYDPRVHFRGRSAIEAEGMGIPLSEGDVVFRCNLVTVRYRRMWSYSCGLISTGEARVLIASLNEKLGNDSLHFHPGVSYRHLCKIRGREDTLLANCTPPHDIPDQAIAGFLPRGPGSDLLRRPHGTLCPCASRPSCEYRAMNTRRHASQHDMAFLG